MYFYCVLITGLLEVFQLGVYSFLTATFYGEETEVQKGLTYPMSHCYLVAEIGLEHSPTPEPALLTTLLS